MFPSLEIRDQWSGYIMKEWANSHSHALDGVPLLTCDYQYVVDFFKMKEKDAVKQILEYYHKRMDAGPFYSREDVAKLSSELDAWLAS